MGQRRFLCRCNGAVVLALALGRVAPTQHAYGLQPVKFSVTASPGATVKSALTLTNHGQRPMVVNMYAREMTQNEEGRARVLEGAEQPSRPCAHWVSFETPRATVQPGEASTFNFEVRVPQDAVGYYPIALVCDPEPPPTPPGEAYAVRVVVRTVASLRIQIAGRAAKEGLGIPGASIEQVQDPNTGAGWTSANISLKNTGETLLEPTVEVEASRKTGDRWVVVWRGKSEPADVFPGAQVLRRISTGRSWPSGEYKLKVRGVNNGRTLATAEFETKFESPLPTTAELFGEVAARIDPALIDFQVVPNAARSRVVTLQNDEEVPLKIRLQPTEPSQLKKVTKTTPGGEAAASCAAWLSTSPQEIDIPPGRSAKARILATAPEGAAGSYYADLVINCDSPDGTIHGAKKALIWVHTPTDVVYAGKLGAITIAQGTGNEFVFTVPFINTGNVHVKPKGRLVIETPARVEGVLSCAEELILPEADASLSTVIDAGRLATGEHNVKVTVEVGSADVTIERTAKLKVEWAEGKPKLTIDQDVRPAESKPTSEKAGQQ